MSERRGRSLQHKHSGDHRAGEVCAEPGGSPGAPVWASGSPRSGIPQSGFRLTVRCTEEGSRPSSAEVAAVPAQPPALPSARLSPARRPHGAFPEKSDLSGNAAVATPRPRSQGRPGRACFRQPSRPVGSPAAAPRPQPPSGSALLQGLRPHRVLSTTLLGAAPGRACGGGRLAGTACQGRPGPRPHRQALEMRFRTSRQPAAWAAARGSLGEWGGRAWGASG